MEVNTTVGIETWGGGSRKQKSKPSKLSLVREISELTKVSSLDITALCIADISKILTVAKQGTTIKIEVPTGRYKKPYIEVLEGIFPNISLTNLPVASLKELIGAFNE